MPNVMSETIELPSPHNVYGLLRADAGLERIANLLRSRLGLTKTAVYIAKTEGESEQILYIHTAAYEFEIRKVDPEHTWRIYGSVAGDRSEILMVLKYISDPLHYAGYKAEFEVYDREFNCIAEYPIL
jgi:hypothetical protein